MESSYMDFLYSIRLSWKHQEITHWGSPVQYFTVGAFMNKWACFTEGAGKENVHSGFNYMM